MIRLRLLGLAVFGLLLFAACSSDAGDGDVAEGVQESVQGATDDGGDGGGDDGGGGDTTINIDGSGDSSESEKLPDWAIVLLIVIAILAVVGVVLGHQNRSTQETQAAANEGYRQGRQDADASGD